MAYDFDTIATDYDRMNHLMTAGLDRRWRRQAVRNMSGHVLDVACGTGDLSLELLRRGCTVTGVDLSEEMLKIARTKIDKAIAPSASSGAISASSGAAVRSRTNFQTADAEALPFPDATFDGVCCAFGIRNFVHLEQGLREMQRVLQPGGRLVLLELSEPESAWVRFFYRIYAQHIIPLLGRLVAGNQAAYTYLPQSIARFPKRQAMMDLLRQVGFNQVEHRAYTLGVCRCYTCIK